MRGTYPRANPETKTMSAHGTLTVDLRTRRGKGPARRLRAQGLTPGVVYGQGKDNVAIAFDPRRFERALDAERRYNSLLEVEIHDGDAVLEKVYCVVADVDKDPMRDTYLHVDFMRVDPDAEIERVVPIRYVGRAKGVAAGGKLETYKRSVRIRVPAKDVPAAIEVDVTPLEAGAFFRVSDLAVAGAKVLERPEQPLAHVRPPKVSKTAAEGKGK
ncbi:MAG: 50S ribosomal protein L25 [Deltaproteobacteria bacterium]|nr:MAG: 50S ribosomal protein L25 [Deltaproteobacteria bacterium]